MEASRDWKANIHQIIWHNRSLDPRNIQYVWFVVSHVKQAMERRFSMEGIDTTSDCINWINEQLIEWFRVINVDEYSRSYIVCMIESEPLLEHFLCFLIEGYVHVSQVPHYETISLNAMNRRSYRLMASLIKAGWLPSMPTRFNQDTGWHNATYSCHSIEWLDWLVCQFPDSWRLVNLSNCLAFALTSASLVQVKWWLNKGAIVLEDEKNTFDWYSVVAQRECNPFEKAALWSLCIELGLVTCSYLCERPESSQWLPMVHAERRLSLLQLVG